MSALRLLSRLKLWRCAKVGARVEVRGHVYVIGGGLIEVGDDVLFDGRLVPVELHVGRGAVLVIGHGCVLEGGVSLEAQERVELGPGCRLRAFSKVMDNHFHPVAGARHVRPPSKPVKLGPGVELGERAIVLPGAWLEANVKLGPGVVIGRHVKAGVSLVGSPPRAELHDVSLQGARWPPSERSASAPSASAPSPGSPIQGVRS